MILVFLSDRKFITKEKKNLQNLFLYVKKNVISLLIVDDGIIEYRFLNFQMEFHSKLNKQSL